MIENVQNLTRIGRSTNELLRQQFVTQVCRIRGWKKASYLPKIRIQSFNTEKWQTNYLEYIIQECTFILKEKPSYCYRVILGVKQSSSVAKPPCFDSDFSQGLAPQFSYFYRAASLTNLNNCSCHSVPLGLLEYELGSLTVNLGLWLLLKLGRVSLRNSSERMNYGIRG